MNRSSQTSMVQGLRLAAAISLLLTGASVCAQTGASDELKPLEPPGLEMYFLNPKQGRAAAIRLGKALFWDRQLSADGKTACASCHLHAGADTRSQNQANPGSLRSDATLGRSVPDTLFETIGPNQKWSPNQFPLYRLANPDDRLSAVLRSTNEVVGSQGSFPLVQAGATTLPASSTGFQTQGLATLQVTPRQAPSVINAALNLRQGWDGRSQPLFNGADGRGGLAQFPDSNGNMGAGSIVHYRSENNTKVMEARVLLRNSSLASHALESMLDPVKLGAQGRSMRDVARQVLPAKPLAGQAVSPSDSVLGSAAQPGGNGLKSPDYISLFREAFGPWWITRKRDAGRDTWAGSPPGVVDLREAASFDAASARGTTGTAALPASGEADLLERNFGLLAGLAIQTYLNTLISNDSPYDRFLAGSGQLSDQARSGMALFNGKAGCASCHSGQALTAASAHTIQQQGKPFKVVTMSNGHRAAVDAGFAYTGVAPAAEDAGLGRPGMPAGIQPYAQLAKSLSAKGFESVTGVANDSGKPLHVVRVAGAMKIPSLRNVALTAPYFHNGDSRTLAEVVQFYNRGGNTGGTTNHAHLVPQQIKPLGLTEVEQAQLVSFLESLTDDRVWRHQAPFDHPELQVPEGHRLVNGQPAPNATGFQAELNWQTWGAVGSAGYAWQQLPLPFLGGTIPDRDRVKLRSADGRLCLTLFLGVAANWMPCSPLLPNQVFQVVQRTDLGGVGRAAHFQLRSVVTGLWVSAPPVSMPTGGRHTVLVSVALDRDNDFIVQPLSKGGQRLVWVRNGGCLTVLTAQSAAFTPCASTEGAALDSQRIEIVPASH